MIEMEEVELPPGVEAIRLPEQKAFDGLPFPLVLSPLAGEFQTKDGAYWQEWVVSNRSLLDALLLRFGAIVFRGFNVDTSTHFDLFCKSFGYSPFRYLGGAAVRVKVVGNVLTANESPPDAIIPFHHEMAHVNEYPTILFFYCDVAPEVGGETPLALAHVVYRKMAEKEPELVRRLAAEGLCYVRVAPDGDDPSSPLGRGWQSTFLTQDRTEAEVNARASGYDFEWMPDGSMKTKTRSVPAIRVDRRTGKAMFFNSIHACYIGWQDSRNDRTKAVVFPNGDTMSPDVVNTLEDVMSDVSVAVKWRRGDVILVDNRQVQHARRSFVPPRRILASLYKDDQGQI